MLQEPNSADASSSSSKKSLSGRGVPGGIFASADDALVRAIKGIKLTTSYGSKIDMITRHLVYLQRAIPGAKAVVFSQWSDVLDIMKLAFTSAGIRYSSLQTEDRLKRRGGRRGAAASGPSNPARRGFNTDVTVTGGWAGGVNDFKSNPSITCFLLHAKSQSAGLTLVNATHVFLCEPLVNIPLELQAINRVHRIGQTKPTTVWLYTVQGTVEEGVLEVSTRKRLEMIGKKRDSIDPHGDESNEIIKENKTKAKGKGKEKEQNEAMAASEHDGEISMADLDKVHSLELKDSVAGLVEHAPGGGEVVMDHDLWTCLFSTVQRKNSQEGTDGTDVGVGPGVVDDGGLGRVVDMEVRREVMADAAERRAANRG